MPCVTCGELGDHTVFSEGQYRWFCKKHARMQPTFCNACNTPMLHDLEGDPPPLRCPECKKTMQDPKLAALIK